MSLLTVSAYQHFTKDYTSATGDIGQALADAQEVVEEELRRPLESMERTEDLYVEWGGIASVNGRVYPSATPVTVVPSNCTIEGDAVLVQASSANVGDLPGSFFDEWTSNDNRTIFTLTYTGGFTPDNLPTTLKRAICEAAFVLTRPISEALVIGATSLKVGDVSVNYGPNGASSTAQGPILLESTLARIKRYRRLFL